jgi:hypothetical protein
MTEPRISAAASRSACGPARLLLLLPVAALFALLVLAACGGSEGDGATAAGQADTSTEEQAGDGEEPGNDGGPILDFYECLRENGFDVPDPEPSPGARLGLDGVDMDDPAARAVVEECAEGRLSQTGGRVTVGGGGRSMGDNLAAPEALLAFVDCLRARGIDMADPAADGRLSLPRNLDPQSSEFQAAARECATHLDGGGILVGPGGGGAVARDR